MPKRERGQPLNRREHAFVLEYLIDFNGSAAAIRAGYSAKSAGQIAHENLKRPEIQNAVRAEIEARQARLRYDADVLLRRLSEEADADIADLFGAEGLLRRPSDWPPVWRRGLISSFETEEIFDGQGEQRSHVGTRTRIRFSDRVKRLELIGRHTDVGAWKDTTVHEADDAVKELYRQVSGNSIRPGGPDATTRKDHTSR